MAALLFRPIAAGYLPAANREHLAGGRLVALSKFPKEGFRPINNGDKWRTFVGKGLVHRSHQHLQHYFQHVHPRAIKVGGNTPDGETNMFHLLASLAEAAQDEKDLPGMIPSPSWFLTVQTHLTSRNDKACTRT